MTAESIARKLLGLNSPCDGDHLALVRFEPAHAVRAAENQAVRGFAPGIT
jgi:hypothetical protein